MTTILFVRIKSRLDSEELAKTIPDACEAGDVRPEVYERMLALFEGKSPL